MYAKHTPEMSDCVFPSRPTMFKQFDTEFQQLLYQTVLKGSKIFPEYVSRSYAVENPISDPRCMAERIQHIDSLIIVSKRLWIGEMRNLVDSLRKLNCLDLYSYLTWKSGTLASDSSGIR